MKKMFRLYTIIIISFLVIWWLNMPFLNSNKDIEYKIVTETPLLQSLVMDLVGPEVEVKSLQKRNSFNRPLTLSEKNKKMIINADFILLDGFNNNLLLDIKKNKTKGTRLVTAKKMLSRKNNVENFYWMSIKNWNDFSGVLNQTLMQELPELRSEINYRKGAYSQELLSLYNQISGTFKNNMSNLNIVASYHDSVKVLCESFGIKYIDLSMKNSSDLELQNKMELIKSNKINVVYQVFGIEDENIENLIKHALENGVILKKSFPIYSLNLGEKNSNIDSYKKIMLVNSEAIIDGMKN